MKVLSIAKKIEDVIHYIASFSLKIYMVCQELYMMKLINCDKGSLIFDFTNNLIHNQIL